MNELTLIDSLIERIQSIEGYLKLNNQKEEPVSLKVFDFDLPPRGRNDVGPFPYVIVRLSRGSKEEINKSTASVSIIIGTYSEQWHDGYRDAVNIMQTIRRSLLSNPVLSCGSSLDGEFSWEIDNEQAAPYFGLHISADFIVATPQIEQYGEIL